MPPRYIVPSVNLKSFNCPNCGAHADQSWYDVYSASVDNNDRLPDIFTPSRIKTIEGRIKNNELPSGPETEEILEKFKELATGKIKLSELNNAKYVGYGLDNVFLSTCHSCWDIAIWRYDTIMYPARRYEVEPDVGLPKTALQDFEEARTILDLSPKGAAALLRLCIQKICKSLGLNGKTINDDIATLVERGDLKPTIQKALDIVRVVGNEAVHPGTMDLNDNREIASQLFSLVNRITYDLITHPKEVDELYHSLPSEKLKQIEKRDKK